MFDLVEKTISEISKALQNNLITSQEVVLQYLKRISSIDKGDIQYNSILEINPDALSIAKAMDLERKNGKTRSKMHGIPVILKDNINTHDKMHTTAGSLALKNNYAPYDADIVRLLRKKGAIILGKSNLTEFANFMSYDMLNGYSSIAKNILCPYNILENPSGSSAGSAVSVTLNLTSLAIGTETGGSILLPSMKNGVVGLKPSNGLISSDGICPISKTLDTPGPIAKSVSDIAIGLSAITDNLIDYSIFLDPNALKGARIGIDKSRYNELSNFKKRSYDANIVLMEKHGAIIIDCLGIKQPSYIFNIMKYEFKNSINSYLESLGENSKMKSLNDIIEYNNLHSDECLLYGQDLLEDCQNDTSGKMNEIDYIQAIEEKDKAINDMNKIFKDKQLDMIYFSCYSSLGPQCGYPTITIPCGVDDQNIPFGTYFLAPMHKEDKLISIAYAFEQITNKRIVPLKESIKL